MTSTAEILDEWLARKAFIADGGDPAEIEAIERWLGL